MMPRVALFAAAAAMAFSCTPAPAADFTLMSGFISKHADAGYNERNNGIGLRIDSGAWAGYGFGVYRNSLDRTTVYTVREWQWPVAGPLRVGAVAGVATGYNVPILPAVLPEVVLAGGPFELALLVQPLNLKDSPAFAAVQLRIHF